MINFLNIHCMAKIIKRKPKLCQNCGIKIWGLQRKYCEECKAKIRQKQISDKYTKSHPDRSKRGSNEFRIKISCGHQGIDREDFSGFLRDQPYCNLWTESFRQSIRDRFHNKCYLCGTTKEDNNRNLSVHHVNYDKSCLCQKTCEFVPLCMKCHGTTNKNRQMWEDLIMCYLYPEKYFIVDI